ncbi:MAG: DUF559 domain-containing protein [Asticcacaulis sp.]|uniref:endonuclease domain-containing protein n=1 Tax=Asticcacaulis sp. TaxID=1872648 RepID=UPI0039E4096A
MTPDHYVVIHTQNDRRIFVIISECFGDFVLTKTCKPEGCICVGCALFTAVVDIEGEEFPILDLDRCEMVGDNLVAYAFTEEGELYLHGLKHKYKGYRGTINKEKLDKIFRIPNAMLFVREEKDETFTISYWSTTVDRRVISKGCKPPNCRCLGCHIGNLGYTPAPGQIIPVVDFSDVRKTPDGELILPIFVDDEIISKMIIRDPDIRHDFSDGIFDSPLEKMFYELAFLDLHLQPQYPVGKYKLDFAIPDKRIAIELDGHEFHKTKEQRTHDAKRDRWLFGQGWHVLRFTGSELHQNLNACIDEICELAGVERLSSLD